MSVIVVEPARRVADAGGLPLRGSSPRSRCPRSTRPSGEVTRALDELGADGLILLAHSRDTYLGDPTQAELFTELDRRRAVVLVHPGPLPGPRGSRGPAARGGLSCSTRRGAASTGAPRRVTHGRSPAADSGEIRTGPPDPRRRRGTAWPAHQRRQW